MQSRHEIKSRDSQEKEKGQAQGPQSKAFEQERAQFLLWKEEETRMMQLEIYATRTNLDNEQRALMAEKARLEELNKNPVDSAS